MIEDLLDEPTGLEDVQDEAELDGLDELGVRRLMIRLLQLERDAARITKTKAAVVASYDEKLAAIERTTSMFRSSLQAWLERHGQRTKTGGRKVGFPDVATAYLQAGKPRIVVTDDQALQGQLGAMFTREVFDTTAAKAYALERALEGGEILPGVELEPGGPQLRIRKA